MQIKRGGMVFRTMSPFRCRFFVQCRLSVNGPELNGTRPWSLIIQGLTLTMAAEHQTEPGAHRHELNAQ